jgi:hypothetical protein
MLLRATDSILTVPLVAAHTFVPWLPSAYSTVAVLPVWAFVTGYVVPTLGLSPITLIASACGTFASRMHTEAYLAAPSGPLKSPLKEPLNFANALFAPLAPEIAVGHCPLSADPLPLFSFELQPAATVKQIAATAATLE